MKIWPWYTVVGMTVSVFALDNFEKISVRDFQLDSGISELLNIRSLWPDNDGNLLTIRNERELISISKRDQIYTHARPTLQSRHSDLGPLEDQILPLQKRGLMNKLAKCVGSLCGKTNIPPSESSRGPSLDRPTIPLGRALPPTNPQGSPHSTPSGSSARSNTRSRSTSTPGINPALLGEPSPRTPLPSRSSGSSPIHQQGMAAARRISLDRVWSRQSSSRPSGGRSLFEAVPGIRLSFGSNSRRTSGSVDSSQHSSRNSSPRRLSTHLPFPDPEAAAEQQERLPVPGPTVEPERTLGDGSARALRPIRVPPALPEVHAADSPSSRIPPLTRVSQSPANTRLGEASTFHNIPPFTRMPSISAGSALGRFGPPLIKADAPKDTHAEIRLPEGSDERPPYDIGNI